MIDFGILPLLVGTLFILAVSGYGGFLWWRAHSKPCDGVQLGPYEIRGRVGSGKNFTAFLGNLAEVTDWFFVSNIKTIFEETLIPDINRRIDFVKDTKEKETLKASLETLKGMFLKETCRLYIMRSSSFGVKDMFVQYGDIKKSLDDFASHAEKSHTTLSFGPTTEHYVEGRMDTLPGKVTPTNEYKQFGPFMIHMLFPFERGAEKLSDEQLKTAEKVMVALAGLGQLISSIPSGITFHNIIKVKDEQIKNLNLVLDDMRKEMGAMNTEVNAARFNQNTFQPDGGAAKVPYGGKFKAVDLAIQLVGLLAFGGFFGWLSNSWAGALIASVVGYGAALMLINWRG